jgi:hypothetical protein
MKFLDGLKIAPVILLAASIANAQSSGGQGAAGFGGGPGSFGAFGAGIGSDPTILLSLEPVQKELEISEEQKAELTKLSNDGANLFAEFRNLSRDERNKKMEERTAANKKRVAEILLPPQTGRLDEISIQLAGAGALDRPDVAEKLKLTDAQKKSLADLATESRDKIRDSMRAGGPMDPTQMQEKMSAMNKERKEKATAVLTKDQREKFESMQGQKFELDLSLMALRFGGPRGNRGADDPNGAGRPAGGSPSNGDQPSTGK